MAPPVPPVPGAPVPLSPSAAPGWQSPPSPSTPPNLAAWASGSQVQPSASTPSGLSSPLAPQQPPSFVPSAQAVAGPRPAASDPEIGDVYNQGPQTGLGQAVGKAWNFATSPIHPDFKLTLNPGGGDSFYNIKGRNGQTVNRRPEVEEQSYAPTPLDALAVAPAVGAASKATGLGGRLFNLGQKTAPVVAKAVTGLGALENAAAAPVSFGRALMTRNPELGKQSLKQLGAAAGYSAGPGAVTGMVSAMNGENEKLDPTQQYKVPTPRTTADALTLAPSQVTQPYAIAGKTWNSVMPDRLAIPNIPAATPTIPEYLGSNIEDAYTLGKQVVDRYPAARRVVGDFGKDVGYSLGNKITDTTPGNRYDALSKQYADLFANGATPDPAALKRIQDEIGTLDLPTEGGASQARQQLLYDTASKQLLAKYPPGSPQRAQIEGLLASQNPSTALTTGGAGGRLPAFPTSRDLQTAQVMAGQHPSVTGQLLQDRTTAFNKDVDAYGKAVEGLLPPQQLAATQATPPTPVAANIPGTGIAPTGLSPWHDLALAGTTDVNAKLEANPAQVPNVPPKPEPAPPGNLAPQVPGVKPEELQGAGQNLKAFIDNVGGGSVQNALAVAQNAPAPEGFAGYWERLDSTSKLLAIGGLSLAAITALRGMFGGDDDEEGGGFLSSILPLLGIGAAAWGAGGGTFSQLPKMENYKRLGNAVTTNLGMDSLFR